MLKKSFCWAIGFILMLSFQVNAQPPNIVFILVDDQGWNGTSVQMDTSYAQSKSDYYQTPNLEYIANQGMIFSRAYSAAPLCSPSRNSILTGQSTGSTCFTNTTTSVIAGKKMTPATSVTSIDPDLTTFPELIKTLDTTYMTAHYGKWHLGSQGPGNHGFDRGDGNTGNLSSQGSLAQTDPKLVFSITDSAVHFIEDAVAASRPFYLQLSHYAVHDPTHATQVKIDLYADLLQRPLGGLHMDADFGAMTEDLDSAVGILLDTLIAKNLMTNTYIVYMSDNGAQQSTSPNTPLQSGKVFIWEGGIRVPLLVMGPTVLTGGRSDAPVIGYDLYPTFIDWIVGNTNDVPANVEGGTFAHIANTGIGSVTRANSMVFHSPHYSDNTNSKHPRSAIIQDSLKMIVNYHGESFELYNLNSDIGEVSDVQGTYPTLFQNLLLELRNYLRFHGAKMPNLNPDHGSNPGTSPDADIDNVQDNWETLQMLTSAYNATADPDGDGFDNLTEFQNGMDPYVWDPAIVSNPGCADIYNVTPNTARQGETGIEVKFVLNNAPDGEIPLLIRIGDILVTDVSMNNNVIEGILSVPMSELSGSKDVEVEFASGNCVLSNGFTVDTTTMFSNNIVYVDVNANAGPPYNGTSWGNAYKNLSIAINQTSGSGGGEIWVAKGIYTPNSASRDNSIILRDGVYVYGGFDGMEASRDQRDFLNDSTIISGDIGVVGDSTDNSYHVVTSANGGLLDGFYITGGNADGEQDRRLGGGLYIVNESVHVSNCFIYKNYAEEGGGMYNVQESNMSIFENCQFYSNRADKGAGAVSRFGAHNYLDNCRFEGNVANWRGGAFFIDYGADPLVVDGIFVNNECIDGNGGAVYIDDNAAQLDGTDPRFRNCNFNGNSGNYRGGGVNIYSDASEPILYDCTFQSNTAGAGGGAIGVDNGAVLHIKNPVYIGNTGGSGNADIDNNGGTVNTY